MHRHKTPRSPKSALKTNNADRQITALHRAMGEKLLKYPDMSEEVRKTLQMRYDNKLISYGAYVTWLSLLDLLNDKEAFMAGLLEDSPQMRSLRRATALVGLLSEEERQAVLNKHNCGETTVESML